MAKHKKRQHLPARTQPTLPAKPASVPAMSAAGRTRYELTAKLELLSPMHLGTGGFRVWPELAKGDKNDFNSAPPEVAVILRDHDDKPCLSGTSIKGLLRRIGELILAKDRCAVLFGEISNQDQGRMGAVLVRGAAQLQPADATGMPYRALLGEQLGDGVFIAARTRIDAASGTAERNKLFFQEMVAAGAHFSLNLTIDIRPGALSAEEQEAILADLGRVLNRLGDAEGWAIGKGQAAGQGRIRLDRTTLTLRRGTIGATGELAFIPFAFPRIDVARNAAPAPSLLLHCPGPFLIADSSLRPEEKPAPGKAPVQISAQRAASLALVLGPSVMGALRARAAWLAALDRHRQGHPPDETERDDRQAAVPTTPAERLFGVTGFRGLIELRRLAVAGGRIQRFTSVRLDRFSGAPIDNALFTTECFIDVRLQLTLDLTGRGKIEPTDLDRKLFDRLLSNLCAEGLRLGHGTNAGFGWFSVAREVAYAAE